MRKVVAIVAGVAVLGLANYSIYSRERLLAEGRVALLELAPVDRSEERRVGKECRL